MSYRYFVGVDPGLEGGIAVLNAKGDVEALSVMPVRDDGTIDSDKIMDAVPTRIISLDNEVLPVVEQVWAMPGQGVCSMFKFGRVTGQVIGALELYLDTRVREVAPQTWQRALWGSAEDSKAAARSYAEKNFPGVNLKVSKSTGKPSARVKNSHQGLVDALCIADYGRKNWHLLTGK